MICEGLYISPLSAWNLSEMAWRSSGVPELGVYFVKPVSIAACAASLMCSGVSKSGSPAPKPQTSMPSAFIAFALASIESVREGVNLAARSEISMALGRVSSVCKMARKLLASVERFNQRFEVILVHLHDRHLALRVLGGIGSVRGIDHDVLAEFLPDRTRRRLAWISRPEDL